MQAAESVLESFRGALRAAGLEPPKEIRADGELRRFSTNGKASDSAGWYVLYADAIPAGAFGCWRKGISETWCARAASDLSAFERLQLNDRVAAIKQLREADEQERREAARRRAVELWATCAPAESSHAYLARKKIGPHGTRVIGTTLVVPVYAIDGAMTGLQFISAAGEKKFLTGTKAAGGFSPIVGDVEGAIAVCEGFATGLSVNEATGWPVYCALSAGNLEAVARLVRGLSTDARIVVCADNDLGTAGNPGLAYATAAAAAVGGVLVVPELDGDFNDVHVTRGLEEVKRQLAGAEEPPLAIPEKIETEAEIVARLAKLSPIEYGKVRKREAKRMETSLGGLDAEVKAARATAREELAGGGLTFEDVKSSLDPVDGEELLNELVAVIERHVILPAHAPEAVALWIVFTYCLSSSTTAPILGVTSPEKRCGKTSLLSLLARLVARPLPTSNVSPAAIFRVIDAYQPTLLCDEADTFVQIGDELRGVLNSGHTRDAAFVLRCVGDDQQVRRFSTWSAKAIALIGRLPDTLADRSILVSLQRKLRDQRVEKLRMADPAGFATLRRKLTRWTADHAGKLSDSDVEPPTTLHDRAADNWRPLLAIAAAAGGIWPKKAREAAVVLSEAVFEEDSTRVELLQDIRAVFDGQATDRISSEDLVKALIVDEARPWATYNKGKPISQRQVAKMLRLFKIVPGSVRFGDKTQKGYALERFQEAFSHYLSDPPLRIRHNGTSQQIRASRRNLHPAQKAACAGRKLPGNPVRTPLVPVCRIKTPPLEKKRN